MGATSKGRDCRRGEGGGLLIRGGKESTYTYKGREAAYF